MPIKDTLQNVFNFILIVNAIKQEPDFLKLSQSGHLLMNCLVCSLSYTEHFYNMFIL